MIDMRHNWDTQAKNGTHNQQYDVWVDPKLGGRPPTILMGESLASAKPADVTATMSGDTQLDFVV